MVARGVRVVLAGVLAGLLVVVFATGAWADATRDGQWPLRFWRVAEAHAMSQGQGVTVAVLDTGVDASHPDLVGSVLSGFDPWSAARDGRSDPDGHGTAVASLIAGHGHGSGGGDGIMGIAPKSKILPLSISRSGSRKDFYPNEIAANIRRAVDAGVGVICIAAGGSPTEDLESAVKYALGKNIPIVAPAGNVPSPITGFPAAYEGVMAVSAVDEQGRFASSVSLSDPAVSFAAPGTSMAVAWPGGGYRNPEGTSFSTALVAGVVALIKATYPTLSAAGVYERLKATAVERGDPSRDREYGWGIVDPVAALAKKGIPDPAVKSSSAKAVLSPTSSDGDSFPLKVFLGVGLVGGCVVVLVIVVLGVLRLSRRRRGSLP